MMLPLCKIYLHNKMLVSHCYELYNRVGAWVLQSGVVAELKVKSTIPSTMKTLFFHHKTDYQIYVLLSFNNKPQHASWLYDSH